MTDSETFRLAPPVALWWVWLAFVVLNVADFAVQGLPSARFGAIVGAVLLLVTGVAYTLALRPRVIADTYGVTVVNPYRTHVVPWRLVTLVDTGEWVQVHYSPGASDAPSSSASGTTLRCWALYVSARARRKIARARPGHGPGRAGGLAGALRWVGAEASASSSARLPEEARYLASLPPAKAMAVRLAWRAGRERTRLNNSNNSVRATATWSWPALAAVGVPAAILLAVVLA